MIGAPVSRRSSTGEPGEGIGDNRIERRIAEHRLAASAVRLIADGELGEDVSMADRHGELLPCVLWITEEQATGQACIPQIGAATALKVLTSP